MSSRDGIRERRTVKQMSRVDELTDMMRQMSKKDVIPKDEWFMFLLTDIAASLATIADSLNRKDGDADDR